MYKGMLSNRPAPRYGVDYRILLDINKGTWVREVISGVAMAANFDGYAAGRYSVKSGVEDWLHRNYEYRAVAFVVGEPVYGDMIMRVLDEVVPEIVVFFDRYEFSDWVRTTFELVKVFTNDPLLIGLDDRVVRHGSWFDQVGGDSNGF